MKKLSAIVAITFALTSCGGGNSDSSNSNQSQAATVDSVKRATDSVSQTGDTSALNRQNGDTSSSSGTNGQGSGSKVGGGNAGGPQGKKGK